MDMTLRRFDEMAPDEWDAHLERFPSATYLHSSFWLRFCHGLVPPETRRTFMLFDNRGEPQAVCPLGVTTISEGDTSVREASWGGSGMGVPCVAPLASVQRRRLLREAHALMETEAAALGAQRIRLRRHAIQRAVLDGDSAPRSQMETLAFEYTCLPQNTLILDLTRSMDALAADMNQEQRKNIRHGERQGLRIEFASGGSANLRDLFDGYTAAHVTASGRQTRPTETFEAMLSALERRHASLFVAFSGDIAVSHLFCGEWNGLAFGWSQANRDEFERELKPRHLLEWSTIAEYKRRGFRFYEIGTRWYGPQWYKVPSEKELSIAFFKERFGGDLWPNLSFEKYLDHRLMENVLTARVQALTRAMEHPTRAL